MKIKTIGKILGRAFVLLMIVEILTGSKFSFFAAERVKITDEAGHEMPVSDNGDLKISGRCNFYINGNYSGKILVNDRGKDGKAENFMPVEDGKYSTDSEKYISFVILDEEKMLFRPVNGLPEIIHLQQVKKDSSNPKTDFTYDKVEKISGLNFLAGKNPELKVAANEGSVVFVKISDSEGAKKYRVTNDNFSYKFKDGRYSVEVWSEDSEGKKYMTELPFNEFIYDSKAPEDLEITIDGDKLRREGNKIFSSSRIFIIPTANESGSSIKNYIFESSDGTVAEGDELEIDSEFKGSITVSAIDDCGNISEKVKSPEIILDNKKPDITELTAEIENEKLIIKAAAKDSLSGIESMSLFMDSGEIKGRQEESEYTATIPIDIMKRANHSVTFKVSDKAGNETTDEFNFELEDNKAPELSISGVENMALYNNNVKIYTKATDDNLSKSECIIEKFDFNGRRISQKLEIEPKVILSI